MYDLITLNVQKLQKIFFAVDQHKNAYNVGNIYVRRMRDQYG